ncbi:MAG: LysE family translocator [Bacteroidales bacterium]|nr:LysE family translocator [Bacteroidales bacterium]
MVTIPLGPVGVLCIQRTLNKGRVSGFVSGLGASAADAVFAIIAGFGISYIISFVKTQHIYFQIIGGVIVLFLGIHIFYTNPVRQVRLQRMNKNKLHHDFLSVFFLTITNPLAILLFLAMFAGINISGYEINAFGLSSLVGGVLAGSAGWWFLLSFVISIFRERIRLRNIWWMNKVAGVIVFGLGILAVLSIWFLE